jgi:hypothetical protein
MICPYCLEDVPHLTERHNQCKRKPKEDFPPFYQQYHGGEGKKDPIVLNVVGFRGHGKTVFLCSLFHFLDNTLTTLWPSFFNRVLDQESLSVLDKNRTMLYQGTLPPPTEVVFPRPGIFRLTNMPTGTSRMPRLHDTTVLIYDPPGEAFETEDGIVKFADFVRRSSCMLLLIDLSALGRSIFEIANRMGILLDTYLLGMRRMQIPEKSQHLIVVYTKSDETPKALPELRDFLRKRPDLIEYLSEKKPETLKDPDDHLERLEVISRQLQSFTRDDLKAARFIAEANACFKSVTYTAVSALGSPPDQDEHGNKKVSAVLEPCCVVDPLLIFLSRSIEREPEPPRPWFTENPRAAIALAASVLLLLVILLLLMLVGLTNLVSRSSNANFSPASPPPTSTVPNPSSSTTNNVSPPPPRRGSDRLVSLNSSAGLFTQPGESGFRMLNLPQGAKVYQLQEVLDSQGQAWVKVRVTSQECTVGPASCEMSEDCEPSALVRIEEYVGWVSTVRVDEDSGEDEEILHFSEEPSFATLAINAKLRDLPGVSVGTPVLILHKGARVSLAGEEVEAGETGLWQKVKVKDQPCCVCPPSVSNSTATFTVLVSWAEGWIEKNLLTA